MPTEPPQFRAHARLLTMLGEQLIKNERIALVELIKNSYDADAGTVKVDFRGFGPDFQTNEDSAIFITDDGHGMSAGVLSHVWMNPATPAKALAKKANLRTKRGRVIQGEKGIGRFATFKLGSRLAVTSRAEGTELEATLLIDISELDDSEESLQEEKLLEDVEVMLDVTPPVVFKGVDEQGTQLEIGRLRSAWSIDLVTEAFADVARMEPLMWADADSGEIETSFSVEFLKDGVDLRLDEQMRDDLSAVFERAVLKVESGKYSADDRKFEFAVNGRSHELSVDDPEIRGLKVFRERFSVADGLPAEPVIECGPFEFSFYVFDFSPQAPARHYLDRDDKKLLKAHRIYLYRDGIRVYPYGDPGDDWLQVDVIRGTQSARSMFSNDQTVGYVAITQEANPLLRDKTNREGLLEMGRATGDFIALIQTVLAYLRSKPYEQYAAANRRSREKATRTANIDKWLDELRQDEGLPQVARRKLDTLAASLSSEREVASTRLARTEQLAGVGMSVETASHDLIAAGQEALRIARRMLDDLRVHDLAQEPIFAVAKALVARLEFIVSRFDDVQGLFVSTRQKTRRMDVIQTARRVRAIYASMHHDHDITLEIDDTSSMHAVTTESALLQCLINLIDNASFWLIASPHAPKQIRVFAADKTTLVVTDNGPGVKDQDIPYIFEPFYSGKGDEGKGLGLYIARQNGARNGFDVELADDLRDSRVLPGATFVVTFDREV